MTNNDERSWWYLIDIVQNCFRSHLHQGRHRGRSRILSYSCSCYWPKSLSFPVLLLLCSSHNWCPSPDVYVLIMKTLIRKCTEKGVLFQLGAGVICFLRPWVGKLQVARRCVEWSTKDCICNNGILYIVQSAQLDVQANSKIGRAHVWTPVTS